MTGPAPSFSQRLEARAGLAGLNVSPAIADRFERYYGLLRKWNSRINLTSLPLTDEFPEATLDRLFIEPLRAARLVDPAAVAWFDLGSGGGSPAVPMKLVLGAISLTMVDSTARKTAFLREVAHLLELRNTHVVTSRIEDLSISTARQSADLVTVRAVRLDAGLLKTAAHLLRHGGHLLSFGPFLEMDPAQFRASARGDSSSASDIHVWERT